MIPKLGLFVVMFTEILKTFAQFFIVFAFFILAFSLSFSILLGNQVTNLYSYNNNNKINNSNCNNNSYN